MKRPSVSSSWTIQKFVRRLGSSEPAPGGGSAAALGGALGCALISMVARILLSRQKMAAAVKGKLRQDLRAADQLSRRFLVLLQEDADVYYQLVQAHRRQNGVAQARKKAVETPMDICANSALALQFCKGLHRFAGPYLGSDLKAARALLKGAFESASLMVMINLEGPDPEGKGREVRKQLASLQKKVRVL